MRRYAAIRRRDNWLTAQEALDYGIIDRILTNIDNRRGDVNAFKHGQARSGAASAESPRDRSASS